MRKGLRMSRWRRIGGRESVHITDETTGIIYVVVPVLDRDGIPALLEYRASMLATTEPLPLPPSRDYLPQSYLATVALGFLEGSLRGRARVIDGTGRPVVMTDVKRAEFAPDDAPLPRPDDARLVELVARYIAVGESPRRLLADEFNISPNTADDWIRRAREIAPDRIAAPRTGRPRKDQNR